MNKRLIEEVFEKAGGRLALGKLLGLSKQTMSDWARWGHVPSKHAVAVEGITGIQRERLCPDFDWGRQLVDSQSLVAARTPDLGEAISAKPVTTSAAPQAAPAPRSRGQREPRQDAHQDSKPSRRKD
jgi:DNA-binding transcriptional regulator YdaS (Cro superfamily)